MIDIEITKVFLHPGDIFVTDKDIIISTILGSCVSVLLWDSRQGVGGMNHFILPCGPKGNTSCRYGNIAIPALLNMMFDLECEPASLEAWVIGGGNPVKALRGPNAVGVKNAAIAIELLHRYRIIVSHEDTGGDSGRKVHFQTESGKVMAKTLTKIRSNDWYNAEGKSAPSTRTNGSYREQRADINRYYEEAQGLYR